MTRYIPAALLVALTLPFAIFLYAVVRDGFREPSDFVLATLNFIINVPLYSKGASYLQAPVLLGIALKYYSPRAQGYAGDGTFLWPVNRSAVILLLVSVNALAVAYASSAILGNDCGQEACVRSRLVADLDLQPNNVATLLGYCSALVASSFGVATAIVVPTPHVSNPADSKAVAPSPGKP